MDEITDPAITLKVIGHQWYWTYEYSDYSTDDDQSFIFDSYIVWKMTSNLVNFAYLKLTTGLFYPSKHIRVLMQLRMFFTVGHPFSWSKM